MVGERDNFNPKRRQWIKDYLPGIGDALWTIDEGSLDPRKWSRIGQRRLLQHIAIFLPALLTGCAQGIPSVVQRQTIEEAGGIPTPDALADRIDGLVASIQGKTGAPVNIVYMPRDLMRDACFVSPSETDYNPDNYPVCLTYRTSGSDAETIYGREVVLDPPTAYSVYVLQERADDPAVKQGIVNILENLESAIMQSTE